MKRPSTARRGGAATQPVRGHPGRSGVALAKTRGVETAARFGSAAARMAARRENLRRTRRCWEIALRRGGLGLVAVAITVAVRGWSAPAPPIQLHPGNPHYFLWRGKPTVLIGSGEHYGAVLNLDFDYVKYLDTLARDKLNLTRTFTGGAYVEPGGAFNIAQNTLAPRPGRFLGPWARSDQPGYAGGGNKFDLARWDDAYFQRFRDFVAQAGRRGIVVEVNLFCPFYEESQWQLSPFHAANNVNGLGHLARTNVYTLDRHGGLLAVEERLVRKFVAELRGADNVYYEICNEPYFGGVTMAWQRHIADVIAQTQRSLDSSPSAGGHQLVSQNIANQKALIAGPPPAVSIFNFHYAAPPDTVALNFGLNKVIGDNETGFRGTNDAPYRMEAWDFLLAGGGLFNNLDYSFAAGHEDGTFVYPARQPGGGNPTLRRQLRILRDFLHQFDFVRMRPDNSVIWGGVPKGASARALVEPGRAYALYLHPSGGWAVLELALPAGSYRAEWLDPRTGRSVKSERFRHAGGVRPLAVPEFTEDAAVSIKLR